MTILITGASSGIGAGLAQHYAAPGVHLILLARRETRLQELKSQCEALGATVTPYTIDVTDFDALTKLSHQIAQNNLPELLIFNAGISIGHSLEVTPFEDFKQLYDTNLLSVHALLAPMLPSLKARGSGTLVFISSLAALISMPSSVAYSSSKRALNAYAEGMRYKYQDAGLDVITIMPGFIDTELTQKNDFKMPFFMSLEEGVARITHAIAKKRRTYAFPKRFVWMIQLLRILPPFLREYIVSYTNFKKGDLPLD